MVYVQYNKKCAVNYLEGGVGHVQCTKVLSLPSIMNLLYEISAFTCICLFAGLTDST